MALAEKYKLSFTDERGLDTYDVYVDVEGFSGSVTPLLGMPGTSVRKRYNTPSSEMGFVYGSELTFSFIIPQGDAASYDPDFFDASYRNVRARLLVNGALDWVGWLKPENSTREIHYPNIVYNVAATDGIQDLADIDFTGYNDGDWSKLLTIIKNALAFNQISSMDILVQCNITESDLADSTFVNLFTFFNAMHDGFYTVADDGEGTVPWKCKDVIQKIVKPFYCQFMQSDGFWRIVNGQEYDTPVYGYAYSDLSDLSAYAAGASIDRVVNISTLETPEGSKWELSKAPLIESLRVYIRAKPLALTGRWPVGTGSIADWNNGDSAEVWFQFISLGGRIHCEENALFGDPDVEHTFYSDSFAIPDSGDGTGYLIWSMLIDLDTISYISGSYATTPPFFKVTLIYPDLSEVETSTMQISNGEDTYGGDSGDGFLIDQEGDYAVQITYVPNGGAQVDSIILEFDNIAFSISGGKSYISDSLNTATNDDELGYYEIEETIYLGRQDVDTVQASHIVFDDTYVPSGAAWRRYVGGSGDTLTLPRLFARQYMNDRQVNHDLVRAEIYDVNEEIHFHSIILWNSRYYRWVEMEKDYRTKLVMGTLQQVNNVSDVTLTQGNTSLTTVLD